MENTTVLIIGAGIAGIGAALRLKELKIPFIISEKESRSGGLCRTEEQKGFYFDYTGHLLHFNNKEFKKKIYTILKDNVKHNDRSAWIFSNNVLTKYPFQMNLYGLPENVIVECIVKYCEAMYTVEKKEPENYEDWIIQNFGRGIGDNFLIPYTKKMLKLHPKMLLPETGGRFVPKANLEGMIYGAITDKNKYILGYNAQFDYPSVGGIETIIKGLTKDLDVRVSEKITSVNLAEKVALTSKKKEIKFQYLISTAPIPELVKSIHSVPSEITECSSSLNWIAVHNINLGINKKIARKHWIYFPEDKFCFYRIGFPNNFSNNVVPKGCSSIYIEISYKNKSKINESIYYKKCLDAMIQLKLIENEDNVVELQHLKIPYAYVIYEKDTLESVCKIKTFLESNRIFTAGRFGGWEYFSMEDSYLDGRKCSDRIADMMNCDNMEINTKIN
jgi:UDP-galactopyranose mutase